MTAEKIDEPEAETRQDSYTFLHLSDIHFGQEMGGQRVTHDDIKQQLVKYAQSVANERASASLPTIDAILVTGDIAYSGIESEYRDARAWLDKIATSVGCLPTAVRVVPGNHDIDREKISPGCKRMIQAVVAEGEKTLDEFLDSESDREQLYSRFSAYRVFANGYGCALDKAGGHAGYRDYTLSNGLKLRFAGLNSALLCHGKERAGELLLGARQRTITEEDDVEWVVMIHHPLRWLADSAKAWNYIRNRARVLISGHEHRPALAVRSVKGNGKVLIVDSGAIIPPRGEGPYQYTFNVMTIAQTASRKELKVSISGHIWNPKTTKFEADRRRFAGKLTRVELLPCGEGTGGQATIERPLASAEEDKPVLPIQQPDAPRPLDRKSRSQRFAELRLKFFHELDAKTRFQVLAELDLISNEIEEVPSMSLELLALEDIEESDMVDELEAAINKFEVK